MIRPDAALICFVILSCFTMQGRAETFFYYPDGNGETVSDYFSEIIPDTSFSPRKNESTSNLYIQYASTYQTAHYKCWGDEGISDQWQGITRTDVANVGVVRRGRKIFLTSDENITDPNNLLILAPALPGKERRPVSNWAVQFNSQTEQLEIDIPDDAPVGDYQFEYGDEYCTAYVIFDTYDYLDALNDRQFSTWAYDDEPYDQGSIDYLNYFLYGPGPAADWGPEATRLYAFRGGEAGRHDGVYGERIVELAASIHGTGAKTPMEAGRHVYSIVGQRLTWTVNGSYTGLSDGYYNTFDRVFNGEGVRRSEVTYTATELDTDTAEKAALGRGRVNHLPEEFVIPYGQCMNFAATGGALARAIGIPSRSSYTIKTTGWPGSFHVWTELYLGETEVDFPGWDTGWWKFDSADVRIESSGSSHVEGTIAPARMDGWSDFVHNTLNQEDCSVQGGQYKGNYQDNLAVCDQAANHTVIIRKPDHDGDPVPPNSTIWDNFRDPRCPWTVVDTWSTWYGTGDPGLPGVETESNGYALNLLMNSEFGGAFNIANFETNDDLPLLPDGIETPGVIGGTGTNFYLVDVSDGSPVNVSVPKGGIHENFGVRLYASFDSAPFVRVFEPSGFLTSQNNFISLDSVSQDAKFLVLMAVGESDTTDTDRFDNQVWHEYTLLVEKENTPELLETSLIHKANVSGTVPITFSLTADSVELKIDGQIVQPQTTLLNGVLEGFYNWDTQNYEMGTETKVEVTATRNGEYLYRYYEVKIQPADVVLYEDFESAEVNEWQFIKTLPSTTGDWVIASPEEAITVGNPNLVSQAGAPAEGLQCLFTGRNSDNSSAAGDVDGGSVTATLENIPFNRSAKLELSYDLRWFNRDVDEDSEDYFLTEVRFDDSETWQEIHRLSTSDETIPWQNFEFDLSSMTSNHNRLSIRYTASDGPTVGNLVEAAIDNLLIRQETLAVQLDSWQFY